MFHYYYKVIIQCQDLTSVLLLHNKSPIVDHSDSWWRSCNLTSKQKLCRNECYVQQLNKETSYNCIESKEYRQNIKSRLQSIIVGESIYLILIIILSFYVWDGFPVCYGTFQLKFAMVNLVIEFIPWFIYLDENNFRIFRFIILLCVFKHVSYIALVFRYSVSVAW